MRYLLIALSLLLCPIAFAQDDLNINVETRGDDDEASDEDVGSDENAEHRADEAEYPADTTESPDVEAESPGVDLDIDVSEYPEMVPVPDYPVYYAPNVNSNYFFYDGLFWVYRGDNWYASSWYRGPWQMVTPIDVPLFVLRIPVRYYRRPPAYFHGWHHDAPPRWGVHWGLAWEKRRHGWDRWDHHAVHHIAPLPIYQRSYSGDRYPHKARQRHSLRYEHYRYQPREAVTQRHYVHPRNLDSSHNRPHVREPAHHDQRRANPQPPHIRPMHQTKPIHQQPQYKGPKIAPHDKVRVNKKEEHRRDNH